MRLTGNFTQKLKDFKFKLNLKEETYSGRPEQSARFHNTDSFNL
jgi:hypothetical protein